MNSTVFNFFGVVIILSIIAVATIFLVGMKNGADLGHDSQKFSIEYNKEVVREKDEAIKNLLAEGRYKCCMKEPCFRCFSKSGNLEKELVCDCLVDVMNGKHPCGECIGEILEGEGNPLIAEYFATAITEKFGEQHLETVKQIIAEKYDMLVDKQI